MNRTQGVAIVAAAGLLAGGGGAVGGYEFASISESSPNKQKIQLAICDSHLDPKPIEAPMPEGCMKFLGGATFAYNKGNETIYTLPGHEAFRSQYKDTLEAAEADKNADEASELILGGIIGVGFGLGAALGTAVLVRRHNQSQ